NRGNPIRILDMSLGLHRLGHEFHIASYHLKTTTPTDGLIVHRIPTIPTYKKMGPGPSIQKLLLLDPLLTLKVWRISQRVDFDIIHGHSFEGFLASLPTARIKKKTLIYDAHSTLAGEMPSYDFINVKFLMSFLDKKIPEWANHIIAVSDTLKNFLVKNGVDEDKIAVIPTGVNVAQFQGHNPEFVRRRYNLRNKKKIVMYTGSLANFQGVDYLIDAMKKVIDEYKNVTLLLVGNSNVEKYKGICEKHRMTDNVIITGELPFDEVPLFLASADVAVIPRINCPGIPQKLSNYMAAGKAVVSFEGSAKLLSNAVNGLIVRNGDTKQMANAIVRLLRNEKLKNELGMNAKRTIIGKYDWDTLSRRLENVYTRLLELP
ncbi:MAG: glycosyltransferase family 4 protein, partial [Candidatus Hodarchaeota archaeon]